MHSADFEKRGVIAHIHTYMRQLESPLPSIHPQRDYKIIRVSISFRNGAVTAFAFSRQRKVPVHSCHHIREGAQRDVADQRHLGAPHDSQVPAAAEEVGTREGDQLVVVVVVVRRGPEDDLEVLRVWREQGRRQQMCVSFRVLLFDKSNECADEGNVGIGIEFGERVRDDSVSTR